MPARAFSMLLGAVFPAFALAAGGDAEDKAAIELQTPTAPPLDTAPRTVAIPGPGRKAPRDSADAGSLKGIRAVSIASGEARVIVGGGERRLRPGDALGSDVVREIGDGRIVLKRAEAGGAEALVIVSFDAQGGSRVLVLSSRDKTAPKGTLP